MLIGIQLVIEGAADGVHPHLLVQYDTIKVRQLVCFSRTFG